jgi:hypothetical protein
MFVKLFGILDILIACILLIQHYFWDIFPHSVIWTIGIYLLIKGIAFALLLDFASFIDIICAIVIILTIFLNVPTLLIALVILWTLQKGFFSIWS